MPRTATRRKPLLRWIVVAGLLLAIPVSYVVGQWTRNQALLELSTRAADHVKIHLTHLRSQVDNLHTLTQLIGTDERVRAFFIDPADTEHQRGINLFLERVLVTTDTAAYILDTQGDVVASGKWRAYDGALGANFSFRPYFQASLKGDLAHYVAVGAVSEKLGYYVSVPVWLDGRIVGVAVTKTDPNRLILPGRLPQTPFFVTQDKGVVIISTAPGILFRHLRPLPARTLEELRRGYRFFNVDIRPLALEAGAHINGIRLITPSAELDLESGRPARQYVLADAAVPATGWTAHTLWPVHDLNNTMIRGVVVTLLAIVAALLLTLFTVERWRHMKQIHEQAIRDPLTRLYTRLYMLESANLLLAAHDRHGIPGVSAVMLDLDRFKKINDRFGHSAGDSVLVAVADVVHQECRDTDIPIRYGGEELLIFIPTGDSDQVLQLAQRVRRQVKSLELFLDGRQVRLTISGGIATHMLGEPLEKLIDRADRMLYKAKQNGRDQVQWKDGY